MTGATNGGQRICTRGAILLHLTDDHDDHAYGAAAVAILAPPDHKASSRPSIKGRATRSWTLFHVSVTAAELVGKNENGWSFSLSFSPKHP